MREIKFRCWDTEKQIMSYDVVVGTIREGDLVNFPLMQFTGLRDGNDKEIYEGDILQVVALKMEVVWAKENARWYLYEVGEGEFSESLTQKKAGMYEIIGNIYENNNLIK
jgi:hypothetical protein